MFHSPAAAPPLPALKSEGSGIRVAAVCDVAETTDLSPFYYKGLGGRKAVRAEVE